MATLDGVYGVHAVVHLCGQLFPGEAGEFPLLGDTFTDSFLCHDADADPDRNPLWRENSGPSTSRFGDELSVRYWSR